MEPQQNEVESVIAPLKKVTPLSKYLAMALFIILPFLGGYIGYVNAPEKVVEIERIVVNEIPTNVESEVSLATPDLLLSKISIDTIVDPENFSYPGCRLFSGNDSKIKNWIEAHESKQNNIITFYEQVALISDVDIIELDYNQFNKNLVGKENNEIWITACTCEQYEEIQLLINQFGADLNGQFGHSIVTANDRKFPLQDCPNVPKIITEGLGE